MLKLKIIPLQLPHSQIMHFMWILISKIPFQISDNKVWTVSNKEVLMLQTQVLSVGQVNKPCIRLT